MQGPSQSWPSKGFGSGPSWTAAGKPQTAAERIIKYAAQVAARQHPTLTTEAFARRWEGDIALAIQKRKANMAKAVLPKPKGIQKWLLQGQGSSTPKPSAWYTNDQEDWGPEQDGKEDAEEGREEWYADPNNEDPADLATDLAALK